MFSLYNYGKRYFYKVCYSGKVTWYQKIAIAYYVYKVEVKRNKRKPMTLDRNNKHVMLKLTK